MKGYVLDYANENEFKKLELALKKYNKLAYKKLYFDYFPSIRKGDFLGELISVNKNNGTETYELKLPSDKMFAKIYGNINLIYTVHKNDKNIVLETINPKDILLEAHRSELETYKGVMISKQNASKEKFKIELLSKIQGKMMMFIVAFVAIVLTIGVTYAYYKLQGTVKSSKAVKVQAKTTDSLVLEVTKDIQIEASQANFVSGGSNLSASSLAKATLRANNDTNSATQHYNVLLNVFANTFVYTTDAKTPELILTVTKPDKTPLTSIAGLDYVTVNGVSGFDITGVKKVISIANYFEISTTSAKTDEWKIEVTLVNLASNQSDNAGKTLNAEIVVEKEGIKTLANKVKSTYGVDETLYYHDGSLGGDAGDNSYRYSTKLLGLDTVDLDETLFRTVHFKDLNIHMGDIDYEGDADVILYKEDMVTVGVNGYTDEQLQQMLLEIVNKYANGETLEENESMLIGLFLLASFQSTKQAMYDAYSKGKTTEITDAPVNNYVCFDSDASVCPEDNLYRILGVFDNKVKLLKNKSIGKMQWHNTSDGADWPNSSLKVYLNNDFLNSLGDYEKQIALSSWNIGDVYLDYYSTPSASSVIQAENENESLYEAKVGLMYASDYAYANNIEGWGDVLVDYDGYQISPINWIKFDNGGWLLNHDSNGSNSSYMTFGGSMISGTYSQTSTYEVKPTFYLKEDVICTRGTGTINDPYRV